MYDVDVGIPRAGHPLRAAAVCCYLNKKVAPLPLLAYKTAAAAACRCPGPVPRGHSGAVPPKSLFEPPPKRESCLLKRGLCAVEINRLGATGVQFEARDS